MKPGGTVVEGTAGNTGIGLAHVCRAKGYKCVIYMPNTQVCPSIPYSCIQFSSHVQSQEKIDLLKMLGADVRPVPAVAFENPKNYNHQAREYAESIPNAVWTNQFDNTANAEAHYHTTGPEIWEQTQGKVDAFICSTGTGGTLAGTGRFLKEKSNGKTQIWIADPPGSCLTSYVNNGTLDRSGSSITEGPHCTSLIQSLSLNDRFTGIGQGRITDNMATFVKQVDGAFTVPDEKTIATLYELLETEGIYLGASSALNVVGAYELAKKLGKGESLQFKYGPLVFTLSQVPRW